MVGSMDFAGIGGMIKVIFAMAFGFIILVIGLIIGGLWLAWPLISRFIDYLLAFH